ncbi:MAG: glyoxalase [Candidatus Leucobacter sulfamidivorax]|nr:glyoxalase [Candidatus Leucobacter sulfamidivorax]
MTMIFVNLPTSDLDRSRAFYTALGCTINPLFSDENAICVVWSDEIYFMVLRRERFADFTDKQIVDPATSIQAIVAFSRDSRAEVDGTVEAGLAAGGSQARDPEDYGFMYQRSLFDPDGNLLEFTYMEPGAAEQGPDAYLNEEGRTDA